MSPHGSFIPRLLFPWGALSHLELLCAQSSVIPEGKSHSGLGDFQGSEPTARGLWG